MSYTLKQKPFTKDTDRNRGFTLVEIAIATLVIGLLITPLIASYNTYVKEKRLSDTHKTIERVSTSLEQFRDINGFYPCPAPMNASPNDTVRVNGRAQPCDAATFTGLTQTVGDCLNGICIKDSDRVDVTISDIIVGTIPFRDIQMSEKEALDGYGNRLLYAVTQELTDINTFNATKGGISMIDTSGNLLNTKKDSMYLVLSYGSSKEGAYNRNGILQRQCPTSGDEILNCINDFASSTLPIAQEKAIFTSAPTSSISNDDEFDHVMTFTTNREQALWRRYTSNIENAQDLSPDHQIGIGTDDPEAELHIVTSGSNSNNVGSILVTDSDAAIVVDKVCDETGTYCFEPKMFGGNPDVATTDPTYGGVRCPPGEYINAIEGGGFNCAPHKIQCPASSPIFRGLDSAGRAICDTIPNASCPGAQFTLCSGNDVSLSASVDGDSYTETRGSCASARYTCQSDGSWGVSNFLAGSRCTFVLAPPTELTPIELSCGGGSFGTSTYKRYQQTQCDGSVVYSSDCSTECQCGIDGDGTPLPPVYQGRTCDSFTGQEFITGNSLHVDPNDASKTYEVIRQCDHIATSSRCNAQSTNISNGGTAIGPSSCGLNCQNWDKSNCTCSGTEGDIKFENYKACANFNEFGKNFNSNYTGWVRKELVYRTSSCSYEFEGTYNYDQCSCGGTGPATITNTGSCSDIGAYDTGTYTETLTFNPSICDYEVTSTDTSACNCSATSVTLNEPHACTDAACNYFDGSDPDIVEVDIDPATCGAYDPYTLGVNATLTHVGSCKEKNYIWKYPEDMGTSASNDPGGSATKMNETGCECSEAGNVTMCYEDGDNTWRQYKCTCALHGTY